MNETEITTLLTRAGDNVAPDVETLIAGGVRRGRRALRRRRLAGGIGAAAAVGALAVGTALLPSGADTPTTVADSSTAASPSTNQTAPRELADLPVIKDRLIDALPYGHVREVRIEDGQHPPFDVTTISFFLNDTKVEAEINYSQPIDPADIPDPGPAPQHCTQAILNQDGYTDAQVEDPQTRACIDWRGNSRSYACAQDPECSKSYTLPVCARPLPPNTQRNPTCTELADGSWVRSNDFAHPGETLDSLLTWAVIDTYDDWHITVSADQPGDPGKDEPLVGYDTLLDLVKRDLWFQ